MKPSRHHPSLSFAALAVATLLSACADKANPVLPPTGGGGPGGGTSTGASDALTSEAGQVIADTAPYTTDVPVLTTCDLLAQDCPKPNGCYPVSGVGRCLPAGIVPTPGSCDTSNNSKQPDCGIGLTCIPSSTLGGAGICTPICDVVSPTTACGFGTPCLQPLPGFPKTGNVGYCQVS